MQNSSKIGTYEENGALNDGQIVKYTMKLLSCLNQGSDKSDFRLDLHSLKTQLDRTVTVN